MPLARERRPMSRVVVREATADDNAALLALDAACKMGRAMVWTIRHEPDFFALFREAGVPVRVGVAETGDGALIGSVTVIAPESHVESGSAVVPYVSGWHVHPAHRGHAVGPSLVRWAAERCAEWGTPQRVGWFVKAGTGDSLRALIRRRYPGYQLSPARTLRAWWIRTSHWRVLRPAGAMTVRPAERGDVEDMARLWCIASRARQLAPVLGPDDIERWRTGVLRSAPACYWVARTPGGALAAYLGLWDQRSVKQMRLERETRLQHVGRRIRCGAARALGRVAREGDTARCLAATQVCVTADAPGAGAVLLARAARAAWRAGYSHISAMVDDDDPFAPVCRRWCRRAAPFAAFLAAARDVGPGRAAVFDDRPIYLESGLA